VLCKGPSSNCVDFTCITGSADNSAGSFTWKVPSTLPDSGSSGGYGLKIIENGTGKFQYSTQFGVINSGSGSSSAVQQISDGQVQAPTGTATVKATSSSAYNTKPVYTVSGAAASTGKPPVASTGLYYVPAPTGKTSNSTLPSGFKYTYAPNTAPEGALKLSTANIYSSGAVTATPSGPGAVTQTAIAGGGAVSGSAGGPAGSPSSTAPITAAIGAAPRMVAGGVLAGVGAIAALLL